MRGTFRAGLLAAAAVGLSVPLAAVVPAPARAEVAASEVLTWCDGASQAGQLGAINAFRCVNYLQGAADMVRTLVGADLGACLGSGQSAGAQLMARFIPELKARAGEDIDATPVARHVADWLASTCHVDLMVAAAPDPAPDVALEEELAVAQADAAAYASQVEDLQAALEVAVTGQQEELAACTADLEALTAALATSEAQAADGGMRVAELELELEGVNAEAIARRQEISEAEDRIAELTTDLHSALADRLAAEQALTDAKRELNELTAVLEENQSASEVADQASASAAEHVAAAEQRATEAESRIAELEAALASAEAGRDQLASDLQQITATASNQATRLASIADELEACRVTVASAEPLVAPVPPPAPSRSSLTPPNIVTLPTPNQASSNSSISEGQPRQLDAIGIQSLRQMQQVTLRQSAVAQRRSWATPDGRYTGFVMVLSEGYQGSDYCREIYSEASTDGFVVHQSTETYCQLGQLWTYRPPGR